MILVFGNLFGAVLGVPSIATTVETESVKIYSLSVNDLLNPLGIDDSKPAFSWKLSSDVIGEKQTAYQIVVASDKSLSTVVWDSGKIESDDTTDIIYAGEALKDCTEYFWRVTVWNKDDIAFLSDIEKFETAYINRAPLEDAKWIEVGNDAPQWNGNYVISTNVVSITKAFSLMIGGISGKTNNETYLFIIQDKTSYYEFQTYLLINNKWTACGVNNRITNSAEEYRAIKDGFKLDIKVDNDGVYVYADNKLTATRTKSDLNGKIPSMGYIGVREATGEGVALEDFAVIDYTVNTNGSTIISYDFEKAPAIFGNQYSTVKNGKFYAVSDVSVNNNWYGEEVFAKNLIAYNTRYMIDTDVVSVKNAMAFMIGGTNGKTNNDTFLWLIEDKTTYFRLQTYLWVNNKWAKRGNDINLTSAVAHSAMADGFNLKIKVSDDGVYTFIEDVLAAKSNLSDLGVLPSLGYFGVRAATNEGFVLENFCVIDYSLSLNGNKVVSYDFDEKPSVMTNQYSIVENGKFYAVSDASVNNNWYGEDALAKGVTSFAPQYGIEVDVLSFTKAFGLLYGSAARTNGETCFWLVEDKGSYCHLQTYVWMNNKWAKYGTDTKLTANEADYAAMKDGFKLKVTVTNDAVYTYIDGVLLSVVSESTLGMLPEIGFVGVREATGEGVALDNFKVIDYTADSLGKTLVEYNFSTKPTILTNKYSVVEDGVFYAVSDAAVNNNWYGEEMFAAGLKTVGNNTNKVHYKYTTNVSCTSGGISFVFSGKSVSDFLMWRFEIGESGVILRPSILTSGKWTYASDIDLSDYISVEKLANGCKIAFVVTDDTVETYIDDVAVNSFSLSIFSTKATLGKFGYWVSSNDKYSLSNIIAENYSGNPQESKIFDYDCVDFNPTYRGKIIDKKLQIDGANATGLAIIHYGTDTFRKQFTVFENIAKARLYITSTGVFNAYMNGERIGNPDGQGGVLYEELAPGWTYIPERTCYITYDITDYLTAGENTIAVGVNHAWSGIKNHISNEPNYEMKLRAQIVIEYTDGSEVVVATDESWDSNYIGPIMLGEIYQGEYYDATTDISFRENGFDTRYWNSSKAVSYNTPLAARVGGQIYVRKDLERVPQSVTVYNSVTDVIEGVQYGKISVNATYGDEEFTLRAGETAVVDLGQNFAGWENIILSGEKGTKVNLRHAEVLNDNMGLISRQNDGPEGSVHTKNLRDAAAKTVFVLSGGEDICRPTTTYYGFRYIEITATADITVKKVRGEVATSITGETGDFVTSDSRINQLFSNVMWTQYSNFFGLPTDCPQRSERLGYGGDALMFIDAAVYNAEIKAFLKNFMLSEREGQAPDGGYSSYFPNKETAGSLWAGVAGYGDAAVLMTYSYYRQYGDLSLVEDMYESMTAYMDYLASMGAERKNQKFGDWLSYINDDAMINYVSYVYTIWDAQVMQEMAEALGKADDIKKWADMEATHKKYYREKFLDENGELTLPHQTAHLFAVKLGLYEGAEEIARGKENLIASIRNNGTKLNTGLYGTSILMETLVEIGEIELAYELLFQDANPSWLYLVDQGATTIWERWNSYTKENGLFNNAMNSFNHHAFGIISEYFYSTILGINPDDVGYKTILLNPIPTEKLEFAKGSYDSVNGLIESSWVKNDNGSYRYSFTVPMNTTATVKLKKQAYSTYYVNGVRFDKLNMSQNGAEYLGSCDGVEIFAVTSGKFDFTVKTAQKLYVKNTDGIEKFDFDVTGLSEYVGKVYTASGKAWYTFTTEETGIVEALNSKFNFYYNRESVYNQRDIFTNGDTADTYAGNGNYESRWILLYNDFLQRQGSKKYGEIFRKIDSLVPKTTLGNEVYVKNFQTSYDIRFESEEYGAVILGFRQQTSGKYCSAIYKLVQNQAFVALGRKGITIASGNDIVSGKNAQGDMYNAFQTAVFDTPLPQEVTVKVRVVDNECTVEIYERSTLNLLYSFAEELSYNEAGSIAYSVSTVGHDIGNIELTALDANGDICDIAIPYNADSNILAYKHGRITVTDVTETNDGFVYKLTSDVDDGWYIKAKSVKVEDGNGNVAAALPVASN